MKHKMVLNVAICTSALGMASNCSGTCLNILSASQPEKNNQVLWQENTPESPLEIDKIKDSASSKKSFCDSKPTLSDSNGDYLKSKENKKLPSFSRCYKTLTLIPKIIKYYTISAVTGLFLVASTDAITNKITGIKPIETMFSWFRGGDAPS